ncbi:MAG: class I mannose-6-phosphate isomerase [Phycisphaerae bacterium]|nr:class I mannose-6-phosphate isomerase [Phycisphaerae bacterium]
MDVYPLKFEPIYKEKIWGGRNLERLFGRQLPPDALIGESWDLADLTEGVSVVRNGLAKGRTLTDLTHEMGKTLLGKTPPTEDGRFPLLLKLLDANDILSLQVHPDAVAVAQIGPDAALKTECWYMVESREGYIYKGVVPGITPQQFRRAIETDTAEKCTRRIECETGDFHYLPAGTVHAIGPGLLVAEVQTPSNTTYRVTDWGRGREIHVERSMQCIHFDPADAPAPGAGGNCLLKTEYFEVYLHEPPAGEHGFTGGQCTAWMILQGQGGTITGDFDTPVDFVAGDTILVPAALENLTVTTAGPGKCLEIKLPPTV